MPRNLHIQRMFGEKVGDNCMVNSTTSYISRTIKHQPQLVGVSMWIRDPIDSLQRNVR